MKYKDWNIESITGYKPISTFYMDFSIADHFGTDAIRDTYNRAFKSWSEDYKMLTELVMVLNWKIFKHFERNEVYARLYQDLYMELNDWALEHLEGDELTYYYQTIN